MRNISGKNMELWVKKEDWYPPQAVYLYSFSEHRNVISDGSMLTVFLRFYCGWKDVLNKMVRDMLPVFMQV